MAPNISNRWQLNDAAITFKIRWRWTYVLAKDRGHCGGGVTVSKRTITDPEIGLIKAMIAREVKNRDIQFFFNRPDRAVNSGRITDIASGKYSNSAAIPAVSDSDLNAFLATHKPSSSMPLVITPVKVDASNPLSEKTLRGMFSKTGSGWRLAFGETDQAECKVSFGLRHPAAWLRAVAALANNRGGHVFIGVGDKDPNGAHPVLGLPNDDFENMDPAEIAKRLRSTFDPTPRVQKAVIMVGRKMIGVLHVEQHPSRPVIATRNEGGNGEIKEGDIFFRYPGQSARISYADLRAMLDARDVQARADMLPMLQRLLALGPGRALIADLREGSLTDGKRIIELAPDLIKELTFIKEGEFDEKAGAPALRLIGDITSSASAGAKKGLVTRADIRRDFLTETLTADPIDYLRCAIEVPGNDWLPIRYFGRLAHLSDPQIIDFMKANQKASKATLKIYTNRLDAPDAAHVPATGPARQMLAQLVAGLDVTPRDETQARLVVLAIGALKRPLAVPAASLRSLLLRCSELIESGADRNAKTAHRKAIARLDELTA